GGAGWVLRDRSARKAEAALRVRDSLSQARRLLADNDLARAHQELARARGQLGDDPGGLSRLTEEVDAVEEEIKTAEAESRNLQTFLGLVDRAQQAEFPQAVKLRLSGETSPWEQARDPGKAVPYLLQALSCYWARQQADWGAGLDGTHLDPGQVARVRRTA